MLLRGIIIAITLIVNVYSQNDRIPAVPLVVKSPYLSTWITTESKQLFGDWPRFWTGGAIKAIAGIARVDGKAYEFIGHPTQDPIGTKQQAVQKGLRITPTQSIFTLEVGPVELVVNFFTPIDPTDLRLLSIPGSYISISARSTDKAKHKVEVYVDISAEWAGANNKEVVKWAHNKVATANGEVDNFDLQQTNPKPFQEHDDMAEWGTTKFFTDNKPTFETGDGPAVRGDFVKNGKLNNVVDNKFRAIDAGWPVFGYAHDLGDVTDVAKDIHFGIAVVRHPAIQYATGELNSLWESYFADSNALIGFMHTDRPKALDRAHALDAKVLGDANKVGGESYARIVSAALRQAFGGTELVGTPTKPWMFVKEISSDGNCQTVDVIYPHFPVLMYLNPHLIKLQLDPLFDNQEKGLYPHKFCMHDLGSSYPRCIGHKDGRDEIMEVEESANMIIMAAAYLKATKDANYVKQHYAILKQWSQYLVDHGLYTGNALTTDDFLGNMKNSTNLSIKAIVALMGMSQMATADGNTADAKHFSDVAHSYMNQWQTHAHDSGKTHFKASYNDPDGTWFLLYNFYADKVLGTNIIPENVYKEQDAWYLKNAKKYGVQLTSTKSFTKNDWEMFYAAATHSPQLKKLLFDTTALWLRETHSTAPFSDWIDVNNANSPGFRNRPVIGGIFAPLTV